MSERRYHLTKMQTSIALQDILNSSTYALDKYSCFEIGWLQIGDTPEKVKRIFGEPISVGDNFTNYHFYYKTFNYAGARVTFTSGVYDSDKLNNIEITSPTLYTNRGIKVGDTLDQVRQKYPNGDYSLRHNTYTYKVEPKQLCFSIGSDGRVSKISLFLSLASISTQSKIM